MRYHKVSNNLTVPTAFEQALFKHNTFDTGKDKAVGQVLPVLMGSGQTPAPK